jgi:alpha-tubulin suppressor-like RCC1 family protein
VYSFGCNDEGALGRVTTDDEDVNDDNQSSVPGLVLHTWQGLVVQVSAGDSHAAVLTDQSKVFIWGCFRASLSSTSTYFFTKLGQVVLLDNHGRGYLTCFAIKHDPLNAE